MDAPEIIKSGKYLINTKTNEYYKPAKRKGLFSKVVIAICIILIILYTMFCLYMQYKTGIQPEAQLTIMFFGFVTAELWNLSKIKRNKDGEKK